MNRGAVTVSIVSHGQAELVIPLLRQLNQHSAAWLGQVVLTCNLPEALVLDGLNLQFPLRRIDNPQPLGFGANHNQAFRLCSTDWFLVLNPDLDLGEDVIGPLLAHANAADARIGLLAPLVREPDQALPTRERGLITPWEILIGKRRPACAPAAPVWFPGMFMLLRRQTFAEVQGFDTGYHMYCEDFELCARLRLQGWQIERARELCVLHLARRDSHVRMRYLLWHVASLLRLWRSPVYWRYRRLLRDPAVSLHKGLAD